MVPIQQQMIIHHYSSGMIENEEISVPPSISCVKDNAKKTKTATPYLLKKVTFAKIAAK